MRWENYLSVVYETRTGVNQGSVLAPLLFACCMNNVLKAAQVRGSLVLIYADDILIISRTRSVLQLIFRTIELQISKLNLCLNTSKCCVSRVGNRCNSKCADITNRLGEVIPETDEVRYLGIYIKSAATFRCNLSYAKTKFCRAVNSIYSKVLNSAATSVIAGLIKTKCLPVFYYGLEACSLRKSDVASLNFSLMRFCMKLFK